MIDKCLKAIGGELVSGAGTKVFRGVSIDSRTLKKDELFVCIRGDILDGHDFIEEAQNKKAAAIKTVSATQARKPIYKTSLNSYEKYYNYLDMFKKIEKLEKT